MPLDFAIVGHDGLPKEQISIKADLHSRLMNLVGRTGLQKLERIADFYGDADFAPAELSLLLREIEILLFHSRIEQELHNFLESLKALVLKANELKEPIAVIAD